MAETPFRIPAQAQNPQGPHPYDGHSAPHAGIRHDDDQLGSGGRDARPCLIDEM